MEVHQNIVHLLHRFHENHLAHAFLLETNDFFRCIQDLSYLLKNLNCPSTYSDNCSLSCNLCHLIDTNQLPSLLFIEPDGMFIKKNQILELKERFATKPIFSKFNIYIIKNAEKLNASSANAMLKFLEEPEDDILGFFITDNRENVIDTIRSRCQIESIYYEEKDQVDTDDIEKIISFMQSLEENKYLILTVQQFFNNIFERDDVISLFKKIYDIYANLFFKSDSLYRNKFHTYHLDARALVQRMNLITAFLTDLEYNVNIPLLLDRFAIEMEALR